MIESTKVEIKISYDRTDVTDAVLITKTYQALGFTLTDSETPKDGRKGFYVLSLHCERFDHHVFSLEDKKNYPDFYKRVEKLKKRKPLG